MGKIPTLTKEQKIILDEISQTGFFCSNFYFTGGTALGLLYLHHRYSEDLDFFSQKELDNQIVLTSMELLSKKCQFTFSSRFVEVVYIFNLIFKNQRELKLDFGYYPYQQIEAGTTYKNLQVDSLTDIAVNKLLTISQRSDVKDFVDLYFLLRKFSLWDLIDGVKVKFHMKLEPLLIASDFLKVDGFEYLPKMIKPLTLDQLKAFFRQKAKQLGKQSVE